MRHHRVSLFFLAACAAALLPYGTKADSVPTESSWFDTYYQYRIPIEIEADKSGWHVIPLDEEAITDAINRIEEMRYDPAFFAYNCVKIVRSLPDGRVEDLVDDAGFFLVRAGQELFDNRLLGKQDQATIAVQQDTHYLVSCVAEGGRGSPTIDYEPTAAPDSPRRQNFSFISWEPRILQKQEMRHDVLLLSDGKPLLLNLKGRFTANVKDVSVRKADIRLMANLKGVGRQVLWLYYQPMCAQHLMVPKLRKEEIPPSTKITKVASAEKYLGDTRYLVASNPALDLWCAETTVKLTPTMRPPEQKKEGIRIALAANELQSFQVVLRAKLPLKFAGIKATKLTSTAGEIPAENISFQAVEYVPIRRSSPITPTRFEGMIADPLVPITPGVIWQQDGNKAFWGTIEAPAGTPAGIYNGSIRVDFEERAVVELPLEVEVYDFQLPEYSGFGSCLGANFFTVHYPGMKGVAEYHGVAERADLRKLARAHFDIMTRNKFYPKNPAVYAEIKYKWDPPPDGYNVDKPGNYFKLHDWDFTEYNDALKRYVDQLKANSFCVYHTNPTASNRIKLPGKTFCWDRQSQDDDDAGTEITADQFDHLLLSYFRPIAENLEKNGWLDKAFILGDETSNEKRLLHFLRVLKSDPLTARMRFVQCAQAPDYYLHKENAGDTKYAFNGLIDTYMPQIDENYNHWEQYYFSDYDIVPNRHKLAGYVVYSSRVSIDTPGINNRIAPLDVFHRGGNFYLVWETLWYDHGRHHDPKSDPANPWQDPYTSSGNGGLAFFYPPQKQGFPNQPDFAVTPSLRVMIWREGVEDYDYGLMLEKLVTEAEKKGIDAASGRRVLNDVNGLFFNVVHWSQNDAYYLELRNRMARAIVGLKAALR